MNRMILLCLGTMLLMADAISAGRIFDSFEGPVLDAERWRTEVRGEVRVVEGAVRVYSEQIKPSVLALRKSLPNVEYALRFDIRPEPKHQDGYAMTIQHRATDGPTYWYIEFMAGAKRVSAYRTTDSKWVHCGAWDLTVKEKLDPFKTWYRVEVRNKREAVSIRVVARDKGDIICDFSVGHDDGASGELSFTPNAGTPRAKADLGAMLDNFLIASPILPSPPLPRRSDQKAAEVEGGRIRVYAEADGRIFFTRKGEDAPFGCAFPSIQRLPEGDAADLRCTATDTTSGRLAQRWRSDDAGVEVGISYSPSLNQPWVQAELTATNREPTKKRIRIGLHFAPTRALGEATHRISFRKQWITSSEPIQEYIDPLAPIENCPWGTWAFCFAKEEVERETTLMPDSTTGVLIPTRKPDHDLYIPLVCAYNERGGLVLSSSPRAAFLFELGQRGLAARHVFYLQSEVGFTDEGFFDGDSDVRYQLFLGFAEQPEWGSLWKDYYCAQNRWLRAGPKGPLGTYTGGAPDPNDPGSLKRMISLGTRYIGGGSMFSPEERVAEFVSPGKLKLARANDINVLLWTNIRMAPDTQKYKHHDQALDYRKFKDSWITDADGKPLPCWDGVSCNPSPRFSFGKFELQRLTQWVQKYGFNGIFLDLYADTTDVDWNRRYAHFPFYPLQVAEIEFAKALADWCHANGKLLVINCPHPSLMVCHIADVICCDSRGPFGHVSMIGRMMTASAGKPHLLLGPFDPPEDRSSGGWLRGSLRSLFYGELPCRWHEHPKQATTEQATDVDTIDWVFARNLKIALLLAESEPRGGDSFSALWFEHHEGLGFITLNNETKRVLRFEVKLSRFVTLPEAGEYRAILWDLVGPPQVVAKGKGRDIGNALCRAALAPGEVKIIAYVTSAIAVKLLEPVVRTD